VEVLSDERGETSSAFLRRAVAWFAQRGVAVERVMTDNGSPYVSTVHAATCREPGIRHLRTRPYRPQTNGKAEGFIQTMLRDEVGGGRRPIRKLLPGRPLDACGRQVEMLVRAPGPAGRPRSQIGQLLGAQYLR
jgi:transposase InsO family protein